MKGKFILIRPTVVKQSEEVSDWLELDASCRTDINSQGEGTCIFETRKMKQNQNPPYIKIYQSGTGD